MSGHGSVLDIMEEPRQLEEAGGRAFRVAVGVGAVGVIATAILAFVTENGMSRFFGSWLVSVAYVLSLALGALFFVLIQHLTRSGWSVVLRRLAEAVTSSLPILAILTVPVFLGLEHLYPWAQHGAGHQDLGDKALWLNPGFFVARVVVYFVIWILLAGRMSSLSVAQDASGDPALSHRMERFSAPAMVLFGFTTFFAAFDLLMSLDPHWFSTIYGVYYFSGAVVGFFALLAIMALLVQRAGRLERAITTEHYHDVGKQLFAFTVFWAYIAFSQYMLQWYGDIPEETQWYLRRQSGGWEGWSLVLVFGHFLLPFLALISRHPKRRRGVLAGLAVFMLIMHWVDIYWLVMPELYDVPAPSLLDLTTLCGVGGIAAAIVIRRLTLRSLVPERDPRLAESLAFTNV